MVVAEEPLDTLLLRAGYRIPNGTGGIGQAHRFRQGTDVVDAEVFHLAEMNGFEQLEREGDQPAAAGWHGREEQFVVSVGDADRVEDVDFVIGKVFEGDQSAVRCLVSHNGLGNGTLRKGERSVFRYLGKVFCEGGEGIDLASFPVCPIPFFEIFTDFGGVVEDGLEEVEDVFL